MPCKKATNPIASRKSFTNETRRVRVLERSRRWCTHGDGKIAGWMVVLRDLSEEHALAQAREFITETLVHDPALANELCAGSIGCHRRICRIPMIPISIEVEIAGHGVNALYDW